MNKKKSLRIISLVLVAIMVLGVLFAAVMQVAAAPANANGWVQQGELWYYGDPATGNLKTGWQYINNKWYYLDPNTFAMQSGWQTIDGKRYYLGKADDGAMKFDWQYINDEWYYFGSANDGSMKTGWQLIGGLWYYLDPETGKMLHDTTVDGYTLSSYGAWIDNGAYTAMAQNYSSRTNYLIIVDTTACITTIFQGTSGNWSQLYQWYCAPGAPGTPTVKGEFTVGAKGRYFDKPYCRCYWYTSFYGNYLFHSTLYTHQGVLYDNRTGMQLSHGCVRLEIDNAKWIYDNIPQGTKVVVF